MEACLTKGCMLVFLMLAMGVATLVHGQGTRVGFYSTTCPNAESIVKSTVQSHFQSQRAVAPWLLRMFFHDCFVQGCDGSVLIDGSNAEKSAPVNAGLLGFEVIDDAKTQLEAACPGIVSCADILALAARDVVALTNGPSWQVPTGRRDGRISTTTNINSQMPLASDSMQVQKQKFSAVGLNTQDLVTLVGGHTLGTARCSFFNFADPTLNASFVTQMRGLCGSSSSRVELDIGSSGRFDTSFLNNVRNGKGILPSDRTLWTDPATRTIVQGFLGVAGAPALNFNVEFPKSMVKMSNIGVKTGTAGEIRKKCSAIN